MMMFIYQRLVEVYDGSILGDAAIDNFDQNEDSLDGISTTHALSQ